jgi:hypothetical protein
VSATGYAYPWDFLGDPEAASRARDIGVDVVALAATYHATRAASPLHPTRRLNDVPYSASYIPRRDEAWRGHRLTPRVPEWLDTDNAFGIAHQQLSDVGLPVDAWIVLTHLDDAGYEYPDLVTRNAFSEIYPYALCPSNDDVRQYCSTLVREILRSTTLHGVVLEACGPVGVEHAGVHDKNEFALFSVTQARLLSLCFCSACERAMRERGIDPDELSRLVRIGVDAHASSLQGALGDELDNEVAQFRGTLSANLRSDLIKEVHDLQPNAAVTLHGSAQRWATGSFPAIGDTSLHAVSSLVANCWSASSADEELRSAKTRALGGPKLGGYVRTDRDWFDELLVERKLERYVRHGMDELHLYHLGLLSQRGLDAGKRVIDTFRRARDSYAQQGSTRE